MTMSTHEPSPLADDIDRDLAFLRRLIVEHEVTEVAVELENDGGPAVRWNPTLKVDDFVKRLKVRIENGGKIRFAAAFVNRGPGKAADFTEVTFSDTPKAALGSFSVCANDLLRPEILFDDSPLSVATNELDDLLRANGRRALSFVDQPFPSCYGHPWVFDKETGPYCPDGPVTWNM